MPVRAAGITVDVVSVRDVVPLIDALTAELASSGYAEGEMFGYSVEKLEQGGVHLVGAAVNGAIVGIGGVELADDGTAELKRFYVLPAHRGRGPASAIISTLLAYAANAGTRVVRLETGVKQHPAIRFYARHGFERIEPFGPYIGSASSVCMARCMVT
jgi:putative acetyltransferase